MVVIVVNGIAIAVVADVFDCVAAVVVKFIVDVCVAVVNSVVVVLFSCCCCCLVVSFLYRFF